jgi:hypothetical protein
MIPCLVLLVVGIYCLIQCATKVKACRCLFKLLVKLKMIVMFNLVIRVITLGFLPNIISSGLGRNLNTLGDSIPVNWFLFSGIMVWVGLVTYFVFWVEHPQLRDISFRLKYGNLYNEVLYKRQSAMLYPLLFLIRRIILVIGVQTDRPFSVRMGILYFLGHTWAIYLISFKPLISND